MSFGFRRGRKVGDLIKHGVIALLEPGAEFEGKMKIASGTVRLNSHFKGEIQGEGTVLITERGEVEADISVKSVTVIGKVKGSVRVKDRLEIRERGVILGDIFTPVLVVEPGGFFDGQCHMPAHEPDAVKVAGVLDKENPL
ncbi:MAG: bactofilin family protein [Terriglobia bacterium]